MGAPVALFEEFFAAQELAWIARFALSNQYAFTPSHVTNADNEGVEDANYRRSLVLYDVEEIRPLVADRILAYLPLVLHRLQVEPFPVSQVELQVTGSGDGEFFKPHTDSGSGITRHRVITFVYFCHREPRVFEGGELRIFDAFDAAGAAWAAEHVIRPAQNAIVFFPSEYLHEVTPVISPGNESIHTRLTVNGWLHR